MNIKELTDNLIRQQEDKRMRDLDCFLDDGLDFVHFCEITILFLLFFVLCIVGFQT